MIPLPLIAFVKKNLPWIIIGVVAIVVFLFVFNLGKDSEKGKQAARTVEVVTKKAAADNTAAGTRVADAVRLEQQKQELADAAAKATSPDDLRRRTGCVVMRQQGRDTTGIPACSGLASPVRAPVP